MVAYQIGLVGRCGHFASVEFGTVRRFPRELLGMNWIKAFGEYSSELSRRFPIG